MAIDFFQFDWIFIDTVVIILLIGFLVSVKIFKGRIRWRSTLSNLALSRTIFDTQSIKSLDHSSKIEKLTITTNNVLKDKAKQSPSILFIRFNKHNRLFNVLTEGLVSYGFDVINIILNSKSFLKQDQSEKDTQGESMHPLSSILHALIQKQLITSSNYILITLLKTKISINSIMNDRNNAGVILINPQFELINPKNIAKITKKEELSSKLFFIFSKKSSKILTNKKVNELCTQLADYNILNTNLWILDKSKGSFKGYETILLGIIINLVESYILKSQTSS